MSNQTAATLITHFKTQAATPAGLELLADMAEHSPALRDATSLVDLSTAMYRNCADDTLWAPVIHAAQAGNELATLTLLNALLPRLCHIAKQCAPTHTAGDTDEATSLAVSGILEELQRYQIPRRTNHGHSLRLAGLKRLTRDGVRHVAGERVQVYAQGLPSEGDVFASQSVRSVYNNQSQRTNAGFDTVDEFDAIARLLKWALDENVLSSDEATLLARLYAAPERPITALADDETARARLRKRHSRALTKLRNALTGPLPQPIEAWLAAA